MHVSSSNSNGREHLSVSTRHDIHAYICIYVYIYAYAYIYICIYIYILGPKGNGREHLSVPKKNLK